MGERVYFVDVKSQYGKKWENIDAFTDIYKAIDYAMDYSQKHHHTHKVRVWDNLNDKAILMLDV